MKNKAILSFLTVFILCSALGQDSLLIKLKELQDDNERIDFITKRVESLIYTDPQSAVGEALIADSIASMPYCLLDL